MTPTKTATPTPTSTSTQTPTATATVTHTPTRQPALCGNGVLDRGEQCDDGNKVSGDLCPSTCAYNESKDLIRGNRKSPRVDRSGCQFEWYLAGVNLQRDKTFKLPLPQQVCTDGSACDYDPAPNVCGFKVVMCLNNSDPNLPACSPSGISGVMILGPRPDRASSTVMQMALSEDLIAMQTALQELLDPLHPYPTPPAPGQTPQPGYINMPPLTVTQQDFCSAPFDITVPLAGSLRRSVTLQALSFNVPVATPTPGRYVRPRPNISQLKLTCGIGH